MPSAITRERETHGDQLEGGWLDRKLRVCERGSADAQLEVRELRVEPRAVNALARGADRSRELARLAYRRRGRRVPATHHLPAVIAGRSCCADQPRGDRHLVAVDDHVALDRLLSTGRTDLRCRRSCPSCSELHDVVRGRKTGQREVALTVERHDCRRMVPALMSRARTV